MAPAASSKPAPEQLRLGNILVVIVIAPLVMQVALIGYFYLNPPGLVEAAEQQSQTASDLNQQSRSMWSTGSGVSGWVDSFLPKPDTSSEARCVIGMADLHGDLEQASALLKLSGAANLTNMWAAGDCTLVQTGDLVDRGPYSVALTKLFEDVKEAASAAGGKVVTLLGNHELMNLEGDFRYLSTDELNNLGNQWLKDNTLEELLELVPSGFRSGVAVYKGTDQLAGAAVWAQLMGPKQWLGDSMRRKLAATVQGSGECRTLFVHAGLLPSVLEAMEDDVFKAFGKKPLDRLNGAVTTALSTCDGAGACPEQGTPNSVREALGGNGPFWTRDYALEPEKTLCPRVEKVLETVGAKRVVAGHTVQEKVFSRCGGKVLLMDVGMTRWIRGQNLAAFKCIDGVVEIIDQ